jgi:hypothetical protein
MGLSALGGGAAEPASRGERVEETKNPCMHALPCALTLFVGCVDEDSTYLGNDKEGGLSSHHMSPGVFSLFITCVILLNSSSTTHSVHTNPAQRFLNAFDT